jgi:hypothetical protein
MGIQSIEGGTVDQRRIEQEGTEATEKRQIRDVMNLRLHVQKMLATQVSWVYIFFFEFLCELRALLFNTISYSKN